LLQSSPVPAARKLVAAEKKVGRHELLTLRLMPNWYTSKTLAVVKGAEAQEAT
jgi:hypothetical protein